MIMFNKTILVTGASGFIGKALVTSLCERGYDVRATVRSTAAEARLYDHKKQQGLHTLTICNLGELDGTTNWCTILKNVDTIVHCAARAHILRETSTHPLEAFRRANTQVTENLAQQAMAQGVRRFIFLSSIGVLGNNSYDAPFTDDSKAHPEAPYAQAKWEAEQALHALPDTMDRVIIRPPVVYGPGVGGNFARLLTLVNKNIPLPFGAVNNKRQFIGIDNLVDFIMACIEPQKALNETFLIADNEIISTTQLLRNLSLVMGKKIILLPIPNTFLDLCFRALGKAKIAGQVLGNLEITSDKAHRLLNWAPPYSMNEQLLKLSGSQK